MAIKKSGSNNFLSIFVESIYVFDAHNVLYQNVFLNFDNGPYPLPFVKNDNFFYETRPQGYKT